MGRMLGAAEVRRMIAADNVVRAYRSRQESDNWSKWAGRNPGLSALLNEAMKLAGEDGD